jgi:hypothetical protein
MGKTKAGPLLTLPLENTVKNFTAGTQPLSLHPLGLETPYCR